MNNNELFSLAKKSRVQLLELAFKSDGPSHLGGGLSMVEILVLDEATSALDSITEEEINATIRNISDKNRITVLIAHRLSTVMHADKIFVLEQGKIIEQGRHEVLLEEKGLYYAMWRQQIGERK